MKTNSCWDLSSSRLSIEGSNVVKYLSIVSILLSSLHLDLLLVVHLCINLRAIDILSHYWKKLQLLICFLLTKGFWVAMLGHLAWLNAISPCLHEYFFIVYVMPFGVQTYAYHVAQTYCIISRIFSRDRQYIE